MISDQIELNLKAHVSFGEESAFDIGLRLFGVIIPEKSSVVLSPPKVEIKLRKAEPAPWSKLELRLPPPPLEYNREVEEE